MTRKRYRWSLQCESNEQKSKDYFFERILRLRQFFYPTEEVIEWPNMLSGHRQRTDSPLDHDDEHDGEFHIHVQGIPPQSGKKLIYLKLSMILIYLVSLSILVTYHSFKKPRIINSVKILREKKLRFIVSMAPFYCLATLLIIFTIVESFGIAKYNRLWLDSLQEIRGSQTCTFQSLEIDINGYISDSKISTSIPLYIVMLSCLLLAFITLHFIFHYRMMIRWYIENPLDGLAFAR